MSIPPDIEKDIDAIKQPSNRILVRCLIGAVLAMSGVIVWLAKGSNKSQEVQVSVCKAELASCQKEVARLNGYIIAEGQEDIKRERDNVEKLNTIIDKYKSLMK